MKIIKADYEIWTPISLYGIDELLQIEKAGRVCYKSEDRISAFEEQGESAKRFVKMLIDKEHEAMIEHSSLTIKFTVSRGVSHELVRHRLHSFAQVSQRYVNYSKDKFGHEITFIDPRPSMRIDGCDEVMIKEMFNDWEKSVRHAEYRYMKMVTHGIKPQFARDVLPNATATEIVITGNYRSWRHFFKLRTANDAHPAMREVTIPLLKELKEQIPIIFDDIEVNLK